MPAQLDPTGRTETLSALFFLVFKPMPSHFFPPSVFESTTPSCSARIQPSNANRASLAGCSWSPFIWKKIVIFFPPPIYSSNNQVFWDVVIFTPRRIPKAFREKVRAHERLSESAESGKQHPSSHPPPSSRRFEKWSGDASRCQGHKLRICTAMVVKRLKGPEPLKHLLASSAVLHVVKVLKAKQRQWECVCVCVHVRDRGQRQGSLHFTDTKPGRTVTLWIIARDRLRAPRRQNADQNNTPPPGFFFSPFLPPAAARWGLDGSAMQSQLAKPVHYLHQRETLLL